MITQAINLYSNYIVFVLYALGAVIVALGILCARVFIRWPWNIRKRTVYLLVVLFLSGFFVRTVFMPNLYLMYVDEPLYMDQAMHINEGQKVQSCVYTPLGDKQCWSLPKKGPGWPFSLSLLFLATGIDESAAFYLCAFLGSLCIILLFFIILLIFESQRMALWGALFISLGQLYVKWSTTIESNMPWLFFALSSLLFFLLYLEKKKNILLAFAAALWIFSIFVRYDSIFFAFIFIFAYLLLDKDKNPAFFSFLVFMLALGLILTFQLLVIYTMIIPLNALDYYFLNTASLLKTASLQYLLLPFIGISICIYIRKSDPRYVFVLLSCLFLFVLYSPFQSEDRMALGPGVWTIVLGVYGIEKTLGLLGRYANILRWFSATLLIFFLAVSLHWYRAQTLDGHAPNILQMRVAQEIQSTIPLDCYLISEIPVAVLFGSQIKGIPTRSALTSAEDLQAALSGGRCFYYLADSYCSEDVLSNSMFSKRYCSAFMGKFKTVKIRDFSYKSIVYSLYKLQDSY